LLSCQVFKSGCLIVFDFLGLGEDHLAAELGSGVVMGLGFVISGKTSDRTLMVGDRFRSEKSVKEISISRTFRYNNSIMDSSTGMSYLHNQIQHENKDIIVKTVSMCWASKLQKIEHADVHAIYKVKGSK